MIEFTWFGTASVLLDIDGEKLLFDPFFRMNKKLQQPDLKQFCEVDYIFNTHPHFDHLCDLPKILQNTNAKIYGTPTMALRLQTQGVDIDEKCEILCPHQTLKTAHAQVSTMRTRHVTNNLGIILKTVCRVIFKCKIFQAIKIMSVHRHYFMGGDIVAFQILANGKKILLFGSAGIDPNVTFDKDIDILIWPFQGRTKMSEYSLSIIEKINPKTVILTHFDDAFPPITGHMNTNHFCDVINKTHPEMEIIVPQFGQKIITTGLAGSLHCPLRACCSYNRKRLVKFRRLLDVYKLPLKGPFLFVSFCWLTRKRVYYFSHCQLFVV